MCRWPLSTNDNPPQHGGLKWPCLAGKDAGLLKLP
jgi:hypothetical protein